jgi:hypothetical protein
VDDRVESAQLVDLRSHLGGCGEGGQVSHHDVARLRDAGPDVGGALRRTGVQDDVVSLVEEAASCEQAEPVGGVGDEDAGHASSERASSCAREALS